MRHEVTWQSKGIYPKLRQAYQCIVQEQKVPGKAVEKLWQLDKHSCQQYRITWDIQEFFNSCPVVTLSRAEFRKSRSVMNSCEFGAF